MAHYDGPAFLHQNNLPTPESELTNSKWKQPQDEPYHLPPQLAHTPKKPVNPRKVAEAQADLRAMSHPLQSHDRDRIASLKTPNSTVRTLPKERIDYQKIATALRPDEQSVYLFVGHGTKPSKQIEANSLAIAVTSSESVGKEEGASGATSTTASGPVAGEPAAAVHEASEPHKSHAVAAAVAKPVESQPASDAEKQGTAKENSNPAPSVEVSSMPKTPSANAGQETKPHGPNSRKAARIEALRRKHEAKKLRKALAAQKAKTLASRDAESARSAPSIPEARGASEASTAQSQSGTAGLPASMTTSEHPVTAVSADDATTETIPPLRLLSPPVVADQAAQRDWVLQQRQQLDQTLQAFNVDAHVVAHTIGPTVTQFQVSLASGVKVSKITNLNDDLKLALAAKDIRIEAPIPGKNTVGIEIPNLKPRPVMLREVLDTPAFQQAKSPLTIALGVDLFGQPVVTNLAKMPHGLIAGATGSGKSVFINSLLVSLLYKATPQQVRLLLIDPKAVELAGYNGLPHLVSPVISDPKAASAALKWVVTTMNDRYKKLAAAGVRNLEQFNVKAKRHQEYNQVLPYLVIIIDELADLMLAAGSEIQDDIARITAKARAAGIHLLVATQRPSVDVITGTIKNNIPTRIAFMTASQIDSRTIIDTAGAERLLGRGDMLYLGNGASQPIRLQGTFVDREIDQIVDYVKARQGPRYLFDPAGLVKSAEAEASYAHEDELMPDVLDYLAGERHISTSKLQRVFSIGYNRAANLIDTLEARHLVSAAKGAKPREVYYTQAKKEEQSS
ncbi:DNA translocase FtsK [Lacticaseibacillus casei]|uniref:DNA translocase FtsK n=2 Tax=Lacticaseibacillus TaxID=2759736 RepID=A0AAN1EZ15_LACCA|nr:MULTISPECIES: DNA translocase FtsK [Lacticaseibacillus]ARY91760.1 cell division protein FtsK [Lacticaseibacillus casei]KAB1968912.1 DNA translocase FtsK [Lacticaseibacillus casei]WLV79661.1 DNA translocase FtsK [Lacticaseibacillus sp. NCIMB 15473]WNX23621.1 DNA translocase FtsK [Lacticaseibacillus casei]WNX26396.1 DNA translocase FtsK [Lacticaseibacillus casei]